MEVNCWNCGRKIPYDNSFCGYCGEPQIDIAKDALAIAYAFVVSKVARGEEPPSGEEIYQFVQEATGGRVSVLVIPARLMHFVTRMVRMLQSNSSH